MQAKPIGVARVRGPAALFFDCFGYTALLGFGFGEFGLNQSSIYRICKINGVVRDSIKALLWRVFI
jgi:hypothetical protein